MISIEILQTSAGRTRNRVLPSLYLTELIKCNKNYNCIFSHRFDDIGEDLKKFRDNVKTTQDIKDTRVKEHFSDFFKVQQSLPSI